MSVNEIRNVMTKYGAADRKWTVLHVSLREVTSFIANKPTITRHFHAVCIVNR